MARKALIVKTKRRQEALLKALAQGKKSDKWVRAYHRCPLCGRCRGYLGAFDMCRICFRELADKGEIMGVRKASW